VSKGRTRRDKAVKQQYEQLPYPPRDPEEERTRLITGSPSQLVEVNHYLFNGARDFSKPFRALVAGGGTGDAVIMLAQQLADYGPHGTVTYIDLSSASRAVVEKRAEVRGLDNIEYHTASLLDLPEMGLEPFDYIDCCGVLHHLEHPEEGLSALASVLKEGGGMGLMLYATLGRTGVYHVQRALRTLVGDQDLTEQLSIAKKLVAGLPKTNWLVRNPFVGDHKMGEDAAFFDLLLHPRDRSYLVPEIEEFLASADLEPVAFIEPVKYDPANFIKDKDVLKRIKTLTTMQKAALAENLSGSLKTHIFYVKKRSAGASTIATIAPSMVPVLADRVPPKVFAGTLKGKKEFAISFDGEEVLLPVPLKTDQIVAMIDGEKTLAQIQQEMSLPWDQFRSVFAPCFKFLSALNILWLRQRS
jgi:2-polyprenyl-3-methyl-5-hydroxy-6-metoxy-1,4-benzoquinol methylase